MASIIAVILSILIFARVGALHGDTATLYVVTDNAVGVLKGTEVWLSGQRVGLVRNVRFRSVATDTTARLAIETEILADRMQFIRRNAYVDIRPGGNLIGSPVVYIRSATSLTPAVVSGDTLFSHEKKSLDNVGAVVDSLIVQLAALSDSGKKMLAQAKSPRSAIGALRSAGVPQLANAGQVASGLMAKATRGSGTAGLAIRGDAGARFGRIMAQKDSVMMLLSSGNGSVGRFRRDSTIFAAIGGIRSNVDSLRALVSNPESSPARLRSDSALTREMAKVSAELALLVADIKKHPLRYLSY
ncbi:MAG: MlaD family protein [Gemmatimonadaceae bacterium]